MAVKVDMQRIMEIAQAEAQKAAQEGNFGPMPFWKPKSGKNRIRIMPPWTDEGPNRHLWWREVWAHWGVGPDDDNKKNVSCPKKSPDSEINDCPICDYVDELRETGDPADAEMAKDIKAKRRIYANIIDLKDPIWLEPEIEDLESQGCPAEFLPEVGDPKIQVWNFGVKIFRALLDYYTDEIDMTDLNDGYNLILTRNGTGINTEYIPRLDNKKSKAPTNGDPGEKLHNLDQIMQYKSAVELQAILDGVNPEEAKKLAEGTETATKRLKAKEEPEEEENQEEPEEEENQEEPEEEEEENQEEPEEEEKQKPKKMITKTEKKGPKKGNGVKKPQFPKDEDGYFIWDKIADEDIENPINERFVDVAETPVHIQCFGAARQRDDSEDCQNCPLFKRCGDRIAQLDAEEEKKKKAAAGKKKIGKKKANGKKAAGKKMGKVGRPPKSEKTAADELQAQMEEIIGK